MEGNNNDELWLRMIMLIDMNAFFASVEQRDFPELRGKPVAVTNGQQGTCIITCSYEARAYGIKTGMRLPEARRLCPDLIQRPARPQQYAAVSSAIMKVLTEITPDIEIFSVDEAFLDLTHCQRLHGSAETMAQMAKEKVMRASGGLTCSIGISGDKTTAKYAAELNKPRGLVIIPPWEAKKHLHHVAVTELCGIGPAIGRFLKQYGVVTCGDMERLPMGILAKRFGNMGRRLWYMCQGMDPVAVETSVAAPKSMGHGKVIPPNTTDEKVILTYLMHMSERLAARLRRHGMHAQHYFIGVRSRGWGWLGGRRSLVLPSADGKALYQLSQYVLAAVWQGEPLFQVQITALDPRLAHDQLDLFAREDKQQTTVNLAVDAINDRFGEFAVCPARLLKRSEMPNVIAPAWRPEGHRQTV